MCIKTMTGATATVAAVRALKEEELEVRSLQDYHGQAARKCNCSPQRDRFSN
jgi:hypothetical protein